MATNINMGGTSLSGVGSLQCSSFTCIAGLFDANIASGANVAAAKVLQMMSISRELFGPAVTVTALTTHLGSVQGSLPALIAAQIWTTTIATGADRTVNVDLQRSSAGGAFATVLTGTMLLNNVSTNLTVVKGTLSSPTLVTGDILRAVVTVAGAAGNQALGLGLSVFLQDSVS